MKKTYRFSIEGKNRDRLPDATKHDIRKYIKRERRRVLPPGVDYWDFDCKFGPTAEDAEVVHLSTLMSHIDAMAGQGTDSFYIEILARPGHRRTRPANAAEAGESHDASSAGSSPTSTTTPLPPGAVGAVGSTG